MRDGAPGLLPCLHGSACAQVAGDDDGRDDAQGGAKRRRAEDEAARARPLGLALHLVDVVSHRDEVRMSMRCGVDGEDGIGVRDELFCAEHGVVRRRHHVVALARDTDTARRQRSGKFELTIVMHGGERAFGVRAHARTTTHQDPHTTTVTTTTAAAAEAHARQQRQRAELFGRVHERGEPRRARGQRVHGVCAHEIARRRRRRREQRRDARRLSSGWW